MNKISSTKATCKLCLKELIFTGSDVCSNTSSGDAAYSECVVAA